jgi:UDP-glucuronate 4-epimerase
MKILITGAAGFIGSHLCEYLNSLGHNITGLDCLTDYYSLEQKQLNVNRLKNSGISILRLDLAQDDLSSAVNDMDYIFHLAAQPGISAKTDFNIYVRNNINATYRLLETVKKPNALRGLINISTSSVYGADATGNETTEPRPTSHYGVTKLAAEQLVMAYNRDKGFPACSVRLFSVYGPGERPEKLYPKLISCILEDKPFPLHEGSEKHLRSYTYVGDIINGLAAIPGNFGKCNGEIINLGTDKAITTGEGIRIVEDIIGKKANLTIKPKRPGDQLKTHADIAKARKLLDYKPETKPEQGLKKEVEWYQELIHGKIKLWNE